MFRGGESAELGWLEACYQPTYASFSAQRTRLVLLEPLSTDPRFGRPSGFWADTSVTVVEHRAILPEDLL